MLLFLTLMMKGKSCSTHKMYGYYINCLFGVLYQHLDKNKKKSFFKWIFLENKKKKAKCCQLKIRSMQICQKKNIQHSVCNYLSKAIIDYQNVGSKIKYKLLKNMM